MTQAEDIGINSTSFSMRGSRFFSSWDQMSSKLLPGKIQTFKWFFHLLCFHVSWQRLLQK